MDINNVKMAEELKQLDKMEKEWTEKLDNEIKSEDEILATIEDVAQKLFLHNKTRVSILEKNYILGCKIATVPMPMKNEAGELEGVPVKTVMLVVSNEDKQKLLQTKYVPGIVRAEYDERYDAKANIRAAVEGWVRHITNTIKPEMMD